MATAQAPEAIAVGPFRNEPATDFSKPENVQAMRTAILRP